MEERVNVSDPVAEGLRRALFSQAESSLDLVEILLSLPILPTATSSATATATALSFTCPLANRAKLRLLEDAMLDACEREGEDDLIDDLTISNPPPSTSSEQPLPPPQQQQEQDKRPTSKHSKGSQPSTTTSNKKTKR